MSVTESEKECPLCMEALDWDDLGFYPCSCGYQICRFCWHRLRTDENGLCPACRQAFPDIPVSFNPEISAEELKKQQKRRNKERKSNKDPVFKPQDLATLRVVQKNLVFVIGLSSRLTQEDLKKEFAHFGKIIKFVHNKSTAYITYSRPEEAIRAIRTLNASAAQESAAQQLFNGTSTPTNLLTQPSNNITNLSITNSFINATSAPTPTNRLKASLGTTKYCNHFLRSQQCPKVGECMYLHEIAEAEASFTKEQMQAGKHVEYEKKLMDAYSVNIPPSLASQHQTHLYQIQLQQQQQLQQPPQPQQQPQLHTQQQPQPTQTPQTSLSPQQQPILYQTTTPNQQTQFHQLLRKAQQQKPQQQTQSLQNHSHLQQLEQQHEQQAQLLHHHQQQQQPQQQQQQQQLVDSDSDDDGLDFDPISVSTSGLRDLLEQQVQQAKQQLQMQNYLQQMSSNQTLANVLFQQNDRLNQAAPSNRLIMDNAFNEHQVPTLASLAGLSNAADQQEQVSWANLDNWTSFLQRSGFGFENGR